MYYHASPVAGIETLEPRVSNHGIPLIYFSEKRENVLVYLSNAIERLCRKQGFAYDGPWQKWGPYGFNKDGTLRIEEYYPDALIETYAGVSGWIYSAEAIDPADIPREYTETDEPIDSGEELTVSETLGMLSEMGVKTTDD